MAAVTICSDFGAQEEEICHDFHLFPLYLPCSNGARCHDLSLIFSLKLAFSFSSSTLIKRLFRSSSLSAIRVLSSSYPRLLMLLPPIRFQLVNSSSPASLTMGSVCRLNKQGHSRRPCGAPFSALNRRAFPHRVLTVASWPPHTGLLVSLRAFQVCHDPHSQRL